MLRGRRIRGKQKLKSGKCENLIQEVGRRERVDGEVEIRNLSFSKSSRAVKSRVRGRGSEKQRKLNWVTDPKQGLFGKKDTKDGSERKSE